MIDIVPYKPEHLLDLKHRLQIMQFDSIAYLTEENCRAWDNGNAYTGINNHGKAVFCGGLVEQWPGRYIAWSFFAKDACPHMHKIVRACRRFFDIAPKGRIEAIVRADFPNAQQLVRILGFDVETPLAMRKFFADGGDAYLYSRIIT